MSFLTSEMLEHVVAPRRLVSCEIDNAKDQKKKRKNIAFRGESYPKEAEENRINISSFVNYEVDVSLFIFIAM